MTDETIQICAYVPAELVRALDDVATQKGLKRARAIERACEEYVKRETPFACPGCGTQVMAKMRFCHHCGRPLTDEDAAAMQDVVSKIRSEES